MYIPAFFAFNLEKFFQVKLMNASGKLNSYG